ncbi:hypothetical protein CYMTET_44727 [Cymbomonas tetramitiformis]|uniref:Transmembrane protein n=1 Tax=Cymbomonas tetramitiformis TaxID=36881 RepID=A0AAE0EYR2_9CHLO|nr:hypothetical protein CYMTET_44727 [Cymbomonas tetramitiformis]
MRAVNVNAALQRVYSRTNSQKSSARNLPRKSLLQTRLVAEATCTVFAASPRPGKQAFPCRSSRNFATCVSYKSKDSFRLSAGKGFGKVEEPAESVSPESERKGPTIVKPAADKVIAGDITKEQEYETYAVGLLVILFLVILLLGIFLAASGFLPEEYDRFAEEVIYPAYSPLLLVFLGCSSLYGLYKAGKGEV